VQAAASELQSQKALQKKVHLSSSITTVLKSGADAVAAEITADGGKAAVYGCNVSDYSACEKMAKTSWRHMVIWIFWSTMPVSHGMIFLMKMSEEAFDAVICDKPQGNFLTRSVIFHAIC